MRRSLGLWHATFRIALVKQDLPLQVALLDIVTVNQQRLANSGPHQQLCLHRSQRPAADHGRTASGQPLLPLAANLGEQPLPRIAVVGVGRHAAIEGSPVVRC